MSSKKPTFDGFPKQTIKFLRELARNNNRDWFQSNKARYEQQVIAPAFEFITAFAPRLKKISPNFLAIPKKSGGSLGRIHRDMRFSKDKQPYNTHVAIHFRHEASTTAGGGQHDGRRRQAGAGDGGLLQSRGRAYRGWPLDARPSRAPGDSQPSDVLVHRGDKIGRGFAKADRVLRVMTGHDL